LRLNVDDWHGSFLVESFAFGAVKSWVEVTKHLGDIAGLAWAEELTGPSHLSASLAALSLDWSLTRTSQYSLIPSCLHGKLNGF